MAEINKTLSEREDRYGSFAMNALFTQTMSEMMRTFAPSPGLPPVWEALEPFQKEALEMMAHKISRILNGDPNYADSWHDIAGYATLVEIELNGDQT